MLEAHNQVTKMVRDLDDDNPTKRQVMKLAKDATRIAQPKAARALTHLETIIASPAPWKTKWQAYWNAKPYTSTGPAADWYKSMQGNIANGIRRNRLPLSGAVMGFFGAILLWGGLAYCIGMARRSRLHRPSSSGA